MPHEINSIGFVGTTPWHGLGNRLRAGASIEEWKEQAGMDWTVESSPVFYRAGDAAHMDSDHQLFYRSDMPETVLGIGSQQFQPVQPGEIIDFYAMFSQETELEIHTAGCLGNGSRLWALATNKASFNIGGHDEHKNFVLVATANDGTMATRILDTDIRVVCANTARAALGTSGGMSINHRSSVDWTGVRDWVRNETQQFAVFGELMAALKRVEVTPDDAVDMACKLVVPKWDKKGTPPRSLKKFLEVQGRGVGQHEAGAHNAYAFFNGTTRYVDHDKYARTQDSRLKSAWFGAGANLKTATLNMLVQQCAERWNQAEPVRIAAELEHLADAA